MSECPPDCLECHQDRVQRRYRPPMLMHEIEVPEPPVDTPELCPRRPVDTLSQNPGRAVR